MPGLSWPLVQGIRDVTFIDLEVGWIDGVAVGALRNLLPHWALGLLVASSPPEAVRIANVDPHAGVEVV